MKGKEFNKFKDNIENAITMAWGHYKYTGEDKRIIEYLKIARNKIDRLIGRMKDEDILHTP